MEAPEDLVKSNENAMDIEEKPELVPTDPQPYNPLYNQNSDKNINLGTTDKFSIQLNPEIEQERQLLQENIKKFLTINNVYNMMPSNSEVIAIDDLASLHDLLYV